MPTQFEIIRRRLEEHEGVVIVHIETPYEGEEPDDSGWHDVREFFVAPTVAMYDQDTLRAFAEGVFAPDLAPNEVFGFWWKRDCHFGLFCFHEKSGRDGTGRASLTSVRFFPSRELAQYVLGNSSSKSVMSGKHVAAFRDRETGRPKPAPV